MKDKGSFDLNKYQPNQQEKAKVQVDSKSNNSYEDESDKVAETQQLQQMLNSQEPNVASSPQIGKTMDG